MLTLWRLLRLWKSPLRKFDRIGRRYREAVSGARRNVGLTKRMVLILPYSTYLILPPFPGLA
jgi:hypothetical protein